MIILYTIASLVGYSYSTLLVYTFGNRDLLLNTSRYQIANFGNVPYGQQIHGQLFLPPISQNGLQQEQFCDRNNINSFSPYFTYKPDKWIISTKQGCPITQKAILAQNLQAKLLIIIDDESDNSKELIISDDGNGYQIYIPVIMISYNEAKTIYNKLQQDQPGGSLNAHIKFDQIMKTQKPKVLFGLDISNRDTFKLIKNFKKYYDELKDFIEFDIFYHFLQCTKCKVFNYSYPQIDCINNGRYCQLDPNGYESGNGADVVMEQYRQLCLWNLNRTYWWRYMNYFSSQCSKPNQFQSCFQFYITEEIQNSLEWCLFQQDEEIKLLENQFILKMKSGIVYFPGLTINGKNFRGNMDVDTIKNALCSSFIDQTNIHICNYELFLEDESFSFKWLIIFVVVMIVLFLLFIFFIFREIMKNQMKKQVRGQIEQALNQYIQYYEN